ncbi:MAG: N-6 DNA methylase, partial [Dehalococcoidia bacterium]
MAMTAERLHEIVAELVTRPGHEKVRALIYDLLVSGLGASSSEVLFERPLPEVRGRLDALLGRTILEFKRNLQQESRDAEEELARYLADRQRDTGDHFVGIATDGAEFTPYELRDGVLVRLPSYAPSPEQPRGLLAWLSAAVVVQADLRPDPETIVRELGRASLAYAVARARIARLWASARHKPEVMIKRQLWASLLERVYGSKIDEDELFFQHTYLTIVAKTMAARVLGNDLPSPTDLLNGRAFSDAGITGAVESDFFDWILNNQDGEELVS